MPQAVRRARRPNVALDRIAASADVRAQIAALGSYDGVVRHSARESLVAIGGDIKSSVLVALLLERLGLKKVVAKAYDELHGEILKRIGVETVVYPERDTGIRIAEAIMIPNAVDYMEVMPGYGLAKITVPRSLAGKYLGDIDLRGRFGVSVLILRRGDEVIVNPSDSEVVAEGDTLIIGGREDNLEATRTLV